MDQELYKFRAKIGHEGPLKATDSPFLTSVMIAPYGYSSQMECPYY